MKSIHILGCTLAIVLSGSWASSHEKADELLGSRLALALPSLIRNRKVSQRQEAALGLGQGEGPSPKHAPQTGESTATERALCFVHRFP